MKQKTMLSQQPTQSFGNRDGCVINRGNIANHETISPYMKERRKKKEKTTIWTVAKAISNQFSAMPHRDLLFLTDPSNLISNVSSFLFVLGSHPQCLLVQYHLSFYRLQKISSVFFPHNNAKNYLSLLSNIRKLAKMTSIYYVTPYIKFPVYH